jgi:hypothetical protein
MAIDAPASGSQTTINEEIQQPQASDLDNMADMSKQATRDPDLDLNLPYRTLSPRANMTEFTQEHVGGEISTTAPGDPKTEYKLVTFVPNDPENPKNWSKAYKWYCTMVVALTCFVVALASAVITADISAPGDEFGVSHEVSLLAITVFVVGFGVGMEPPFP